MNPITLMLMLTRMLMPPNHIRQTLRRFQNRMPMTHFHQRHKNNNHNQKQMWMQKQRLHKGHK